MRLSDLLSEQTITVSLRHTDKLGVIEELLDLAMKTSRIKDRSIALKAVMDREQLMSTGLEKGVAVPHAKTKAAEDLSMALGISKEGIDFQSADGKPSHLFFFLLAPEAAAGPNVKVLAQIARLTNAPDFRQTLKEASSPKEVLNIIASAE
jgi:mannitol/fructose-specific phosphotransferase system IIA component (Ntr-type)